MTRRTKLLIAVALIGMAAIVAGGAYYRERDMSGDYLPPLPAWAEGLDGVIQSADKEFAARVAARFPATAYALQAEKELEAAGFSREVTTDGYVRYVRRDTKFPCVAERQISWPENQDTVRGIRGHYTYICP